MRRLLWFVVVVCVSTALMVATDFVFTTILLLLASEGVTVVGPQTLAVRILTVLACLPVVAKLSWEVGSLTEA
jgi:hypothetical protein